LFSHRGTDPVTNANANTGWGPNQVQVYMPQAGNPAYGILRTYVRDSNDLYTGQEAEGFMDSDGSVGFGGGPRTTPSPLLDKGFHMVTVSSQPGGGKGSRLYVDGELAVQMREGGSYLTQSGVELNVSMGCFCYGVTLSIRTMMRGCC
jgi:hypothetical protein